MSSETVLGWAVLTLLVAGCGRETSPTGGGATDDIAVVGADVATGDVALWTSLPEAAVRPVIDALEAESGLRVVVRNGEPSEIAAWLADADAAPDVVWTADAADAVDLKIAGRLAKMDTPPESPVSVPARFADPEGYWLGLAGRACVLVVNTDLVPDDAAPLSVWHVVDPAWSGKTAIARPDGGAALTLLTALHGRIGRVQMDGFVSAAEANGVRFPAGRGSVADLVAAGEAALGLTDTVEFRRVAATGAPVRAVFPDQGSDQIGALVIPSAVALAAEQSNPAGARRLLRFLASAECERLLAHGALGLMPLRPGVDHPADVRVPGAFTEMHVDWAKVGARRADYGEALAARLR